MIKAIIVDDEIDHINSLKSKIQEYCPNIQIVGQAASIDIAIEEINDKKPHLIFLDIEMPKEGGFDLLKKMPNRNFEVIFITAYDYYAIKAFKFSAVDYILKPVNIKELIIAVEKAEDIIKGEYHNKQKYDVLLENIEAVNPKILSLPTSKGIEYVNTTNIVRIEACGSYSDVFLANNKKITFSQNLADFNNTLAENEEFYRCHRSHLINLNYVETFTRNIYGGKIVMKDGTVVEVSHRKRLEFTEIMDNFFKKKNTQ